MFKRNVEKQINRHRKMIMTQVEDFLGQCKSFESVQVVRKLLSITLQVDEQDTLDHTEVFRSVEPMAKKRKVEILKEIEADEKDSDQESAPELETEPDFDDFDFEEVISVSGDDVVTEAKSFKTIENEENKTSWLVLEPLKPLQCSKCKNSSPNENLHELHEFFRHSLLGIQIESEVENCVETFVETEDALRRCVICAEDVGELFLKSHMINQHCDVILQSINEMFDINQTTVNTELVKNYIESIIELIENNEMELDIDPDVKSYFFEIYSGEPMIEAEDLSQHIVQPTTHFESPAKSTKKQIILTEDAKSWLRKEINSRKKMVKNENGVLKAVYKCAYCNIYLSNSAAGFRYHLISKHLKDRTFDQLVEVASDSVETLLKSNKNSKNTCEDCHLKLKDQKLYNAHRNCHTLFRVIAEFYTYPSCNTCNKLFVDEESLNRHLENHDKEDEISQAVVVAPGALFSQGKPVNALGELKIEILTDENFSWTCGHCLKKFDKEFSCRHHLLMLHAASFTCPIDKREFIGFKAVSLFTHHLQNKHSAELFPELTFSCTFCKMEFPSIYDKLSHMKTCSLKKFSCDHCGKKFFKKGELSSHLKFVSGEIFFSCKYCEKKCETMSDLKIHWRSHTKEVSVGQQVNAILNFLLISETFRVFSL